MLMFVLVILFSFSDAASTEKMECTEGLKARATLKFSECQDPLLPVNWCYKRYRETLGWVQRSTIDETYPNRTHEDDFCKIRKNLTSCEHLTYLTQECGAHYDTCHSSQEKREIMRMWIKQFVRGTHELHWEFAFADNNQQILDGDCNHILKAYFDEKEIAEIIILINTGPNTFEDVTYEFGDTKHSMVRTTKISNLTETFGVLKDTAGNRIGYNEPYDGPATKPSHWQFCSWKMKHNIDSEGLYSKALNGLFHCDGKCNTNDGDDQEWGIESLRMSYMDVETGKGERNGYPDQDPIKGDENIFNCVWNAQWHMQDAAAENIANLDKVKMELCKPFKTLLENCTIPISWCIEDIAIKELVMGEFLKDMAAKTKRMMETVEKNTKPNFFGDFTYDDCAIFGGDVAGAMLYSTGWLQLVVPLFVPYLLFKFNS